ncbi:MAG: diiron oxygenase, partial [Rhodococcus sp. (in: high G+C Gram-positive bacteria)]
KEVQRELGIPREVVQQVWWSSEQSQKTLRDMFGDVRMLCDEMGMMNRFSRRVWRLMKIDGRASRFRSEPASAAA